MRFAIMVTGPAYGTQQASSALQFAHALLKEGHELSSVFFYREGVYNANLLTSPASDEYDLVRAWQQLNQQHGVTLNICIAWIFFRQVKRQWLLNRGFLNLRFQNIIMIFMKLWWSNMERGSMCSTDSLTPSAAVRCVSFAIMTGIYMNILTICA